MLNHVAILVPSVDRAAKFLAALDFHVGAKETWDGEGTAEIYVGESKLAAKLLLVEPIKPGAYRRALETRGPGLHHIAVDVTDLEVFVTKLAGSGWHLLPQSLKMAREQRTVWLARPGTAMLIEVQQRQDLAGSPAFISALRLPLNGREQKMVAALGVEQLQVSDDAATWIIIGPRKINLTDLLH